MEHEVRAEHVCHVGQRPRSLLGHAGDHIIEDLEASYQDNVDGPSSYRRSMSARSNSGAGTGPTPGEEEQGENYLLRWSSWR